MPINNSTQSRARWTVALMGSFRLEKDGVVVQSFSGRKEDLLLAYLAISPGTAHRRDVLAATFWPDKPSTTARRYLSYALHLLLAELKSHGAEGIILVDGRKTLRLHDTTGTDVKAFLRLVSDAFKRNDPAQRESLLEEALMLYGDGLLPGYQAPWIDSVRQPLERVHEKAAEAMPQSSQADRDLLGLLSSAFLSAPAAEPHREPEPPRVVGPPEPVSPRTLMVLPGDWDRLHSLIKEVEPHLSGPERSQWLTRLDVEYPLIAIMLSTAIDERDVARGLDLALALWRYWLARGNMVEGSRLVESLLERDSTSGETTRGRALHVLGTLEYYAGSLESAQQHLEAARTIWLESENDEQLIKTIANEALVANRRGDLERARKLLSESIAIARKRSEQETLMAGLLNLARTELQLKNTVEARRLLNERLQLAEKSGDSRSAASTHAYLATADLDDDDEAGAHSHASRALEISLQIGSTKWQSYSYRLLGHLALRQSQNESAIDFLKRGLAVAQISGDWREIGESYRYLGEAVEANGDIRYAAILAGQAAEMLRAAGDSENEQLAREAWSRISDLINDDTADASAATSSETARVIESATRNL